MSHEITVREDGFAEAAFAMTPAWHGLGTVLDHPMTGREALTTAGLDWEVWQEDVFHKSPAWTELAPDYSKVEGHRLNVRSDSKLVLGMVTDQYRVVQNVEAFGFLDALVENHEMLYESAFSLYGGRKVVMLARMPGYREVVAGDSLLPYVMLSLSHDGSESIRFGPIATRTVCANTYAIANREKGVSDLIITHAGDIKAKLARARNILGIASRQFAQYAEIGQQLAQRVLTRQEWLDYLEIMCPMPDPRDPDYTDRRAESIAETRFAIIRAFTNPRQTLPGIERSCWAAYNAVSEHIEHLPRRGATRERKAEARFNVCLYGAGRDMKERALQTACRFAGLALAT